MNKDNSGDKDRERKDTPNKSPGDEKKRDASSSNMSQLTINQAREDIQEPVRPVPQTPSNQAANSGQSVLVSQEQGPHRPMSQRRANKGPNNAQPIHSGHVQELHRPVAQRPVNFGPNPGQSILAQLIAAPSTPPPPTSSSSSVSQTTNTLGGNAYIPFDMFPPPPPSFIPFIPPHLINPLLNMALGAFPIPGSFASQSSSIPGASMLETALALNRTNPGQFGKGMTVASAPCTGKTNFHMPPIAPPQKKESGSERANRKRPLPKSDNDGTQPKRSMQETQSPLIRAGTIERLIVEYRLTFTGGTEADRWNTLALIGQLHPELRAEFERAINASDARVMKKK